MAEYDPLIKKLIKNPDKCPQFGSTEYLKQFPLVLIDERGPTKDFYTRVICAAANGYGGD